MAKVLGKMLKMDYNCIALEFFYLDFGFRQFDPT